MEDVAPVIVRVVPTQFEGHKVKSCEHYQWTWCEGFDKTGNEKCKGTNRHDKCPKYLANCTLWKHKLPPKNRKPKVFENVDDRHATTIKNDSLQEKLLDEETKVTTTATTAETGPSSLEDERDSNKLTAQDPLYQDAYDAEADRELLRQQSDADDEMSSSSGRGSTSYGTRRGHAQMASQITSNEWERSIRTDEYDADSHELSYGKEVKGAIMVNAAAEAKKNEGNEAFKRRDWAQAVAKYSEAIAIDATNHVYFSNRSAAFNGMHKFEEAANDAAQCIKLNPDFVKGYHRHGMALMALKKYEEALATLRAGQRVDFDNKDLNKLIQEIEPLQKKVEMARRSGMNRAELLKEEGNDAFKKAHFERAIELYTEALEASDRQDSPLALSCYNNRAACNQQLSAFSAVVRDCTHVLEYEPQNQKALLRRALAYEGLERYRLALQDIRTLLSINPNIEIANKAQHRLGEYVRKLKSDN
ncbi:hypothetical protein P43SY_008701 [Pythium insidiosum]|uniref:Hsp70-Hsp90 organising protein n=1 Tax=Pythium insidiosum TaxID=114742 RepID=A0AAD5QAG3_PYTIN|nr:hypothetical protein P43SY_008701 [Pythium insidiosum]